MKKKCLITLSVFCLLVISLKAQDKYKLGERIIIGSSLTYIRNVDEELQLRFNEFTWNKNIAVNLTDRFYFGISHQNIYTNSTVFSRDKVKNQYTMVGLFSQFDFLSKYKNRLFAELSWNYGNYCTCGSDDPYKKEGLNYLGAGVGYDLPINHFLSLDLSFVVYYILGDMPGKYAFTQYVVGVNVDLVRERK